MVVGPRQQVARAGTGSGMEFSTRGVRGAAYNLLALEV